MTAAEMGRKGGRAKGKAKVRGDAGHYASLAAQRWAGMTADERSAEMSRRRRVGTKRHK